MNFPKSTIKKSLHIIPDSLKDGITGDAQVTIGYQIYNLAKLTHTTAGIANLQFGDYNVNKVGLYGKNIEIHADTGRLNEYATDDIFIGSAGSMLRIGMYSSTTFDNGVNFMLMTPDVTKFQDKQVIIAANNNYQNASKALINNVTTNYGGCLLVGDYNTAHIALDNFQIQAKKNGVDAADLYLNPSGSDIILNGSKSKLRFILTNGLIASSLFFSSSKNDFSSFIMGDRTALDVNSLLCLESMTDVIIEAHNTYIKENTHIEETLNVYGNSNLNSDIIIKADEWENNMITISGSVSEHTAKVQGYADLILDSYEYRDENSHIVYHYPALKFFYRYRKYNGSTYGSYNKRFRIEAGEFNINNVAYTGLIIGGTTYDEGKFPIILTDDVFLGHSLTVTENLQVYGNTKLGNINNLDNFKALTVYGKSRFVGNGIELYYKTPYIDFHFGGNASSTSLSDSSSSDDYTARIIEETSGIITVDSKLKSTFITTSYGGSTGAPANPVEGQLYFEYI